jgi:hypothetical protein
MQTTETLAYRALAIVAENCDHARALDGAGFSGADAEFGHDLVRKAARFGWSERQHAAAVKIARKYRKQVSARGTMPADWLELLAQEAAPARPAKPEAVDVCLRFLKVKAHYDRAITFFAGSLKNSVCVPKSLIRSLNEGDGEVLVTLPDWFVNKEGLGYWRVTA